jgi:GAF domain-containing protein
MSLTDSEIESQRRQDAFPNRGELSTGATPLWGKHPNEIDDLRKGRDEIAELVAAEPDYQALFERMMAVTGRFTDFDWANLFVYSPAREYSRMVCRHGSPIEYQSRWFRTDPAYVDWLEQPQTWMHDLEQDIRSGPAPQMLERPDVKIAIDAGTRALIALPVREGGRIKGGLCLLSKKRGLYCAKTRDTLECLMLDQALLAVLHAWEREESFFVSDLVKRIAESKDLRDLARTAVTNLARFYAFENVGIFKVNALRGRFELLAQELGFERATRMPDNYAQPLDVGLLGLTYRRGEHVILGDIDDNSEEAQHYIRIAHEMRSDCAFPSVCSVAFSGY